MNVEEAARGLPLGRNVEILATHPAGLVALHKPEGVLSHPNRKKEKSPSLLQSPYDDEIQAFLGSDEAGAQRPFHLLHRLDSPTSGVILGSLDAKLAKQVRRLFADRQVLKVYHALTQEKGPGRNETWTDRLEIVRQDGKLRGKRSVRGREAITAVCFERQRIGRNGLSLIRLEPSTGITHQLRIQASLRGFPIVGDRTYGDFSLNRRIGRDKRARRLFLHASQIVLEFYWQGKNIRFEAESPLPRSFGKAMT
ncbi:MAG: pseudouridine synthase [Opitutales bacterium]|jgi:tRNA pseudouridine65 synthase